MIKGAVLIVLFFILGNLISYFIGGIIPGSVCGMILLFLSLLFKLIKPDDVKGVSKLLTQNMALFFVPAGVGLMSAYSIISDNLLAIILIPFLSTALVIVSVGRSQQVMEKKMDKRVDSKNNVQ